MFTLFDTAIDAFQNGKKNFVSTVFSGNQTVAKALNSFVDAQTAYTKSAVKAGSDLSTVLAKEATNAVEELRKFDMTKAFKA
jgi:hypothetical protein